MDIEITTPPAGSMADIDLATMPWSDKSAADPIEKARRVLRGLADHSDSYFFENGFPRRKLEYDVTCALEVLEALARATPLHSTDTALDDGAGEQYIPRNFTTHRAAWRDAIVSCINYEETHGTAARAAYWQHELDAYDRSFARLLDSPEPTNPVSTAGNSGTPPHSVTEQAAAWANWKVGTDSYVPFKTRDAAEASVRRSDIAATQEGPYEAVPLFHRRAPAGDTGEQA